MPHLRRRLRRNSARTVESTKTRASVAEQHQHSRSASWLSLLDFSLLSCNTVSTTSLDRSTASDTGSSSPTSSPTNQHHRLKREDTSTPVDAVIASDGLVDKNYPKACRKTELLVDSTNKPDQPKKPHQLSASVAAKWLSSGRTSTRSSWSASYYRLQQKMKTENTSRRRSSSRSLDSSVGSHRTAPFSTHTIKGDQGEKGMSDHAKQDDNDDEALLWKTATDAQSGRTYYYHIKTRETQWHKPLCCATPAERAAAAAREASTRNFFAAMEANIRQSITNQTLLVATTTTDDDDVPVDSCSRPNALVRTISTMEDSVLADLVGRVPSNQSTVVPINYSVEDRPSSPSFSDVTEDSLSPVKQVRPRAPTFLGRSTASLRGSMTRLPIESRRMKLVPEEIYEDLSGSGSHDVLFDPTEDEDETVQRGLERCAGTLHLEAISDDEALEHEFVPDDQVSSITSRPASMSRENSLSLESLAPGSTRNVIRQSYWANDSFRHPSFSNDCNLPTDNSIQSSRHRSQSSMDVGFRADSIRWGGTSFYSKASEGDDTLMALAAISREMVESEPQNEAQNEPPPRHEITPISTIDGLEGLNLAIDEDGTVDTDEEEVDSGGNVRPSIQRPQSLRVSPNTAATELARPHMKRRNTCGTLYVGSTMAAPDKDATIKCVCGVFRAHVLRSDSEYNDKYSVFNDLENERGRHPKPKMEELPVPSLQDISQFYRDIFDRAQMEPDCIVISLIYVERLIKVTGGELRPRPSNWRSVLFSCMVLSSKVWDDMSMWNADFSQTCPAGVQFSLKRVNELELAVLSALQYQVKVPASEYAKYYFLLRSLLIKSGLGSEDLNTMNPLDVEGAKQLQHVTARYESTRSSVRKSLLGRAKTTTETTTAVPTRDRMFRGSKAGLEQLVNM